MEKVAFAFISSGYYTHIRYGKVVKRFLKVLKEKQQHPLLLFSLRSKNKISRKSP